MSIFTIDDILRIMYQYPCIQISNIKYLFYFQRERLKFHAKETFWVYFLPEKSLENWQSYTTANEQQLLKVCIEFSIYFRLSTDNDRNGLQTLLISTSINFSCVGLQAMGNRKTVFPDDNDEDRIDSSSRAYCIP